MTDEELIENYRQGDESAFNEIYVKYSGIVKYYARNLFLLGGDREDLLQEGFLGLIKAVNTYKSGDAQFATYATVCIKSSLFTAVKKYACEKFSPLNNSSSLDALSVIGSLEYEPEEVALMGELGEEFKEEIMQCLSKYEREILSLYLVGKSYEDIGEALGKTAKSVDNALFRARKKIIEHLEKTKR